ncbi:unnamed protein product, partial [Prorocentrum cordatum]
GGPAFDRLHRRHHWHGRQGDVLQEAGIPREQAAGVALHSGKQAALTCSSGCSSSPGRWVCSFFAPPAERTPPGTRAATTCCTRCGTWRCRWEASSGSSTPAAHSRGTCGRMPRRGGPRTSLHWAAARPRPCRSIGPPPRAAAVGARALLRRASSVTSSASRALRATLARGRSCVQAWLSVRLERRGAAGGGAGARARCAVERAPPLRPRTVEAPLTVVASPPEIRIPDSLPLRSQL